MNIASTQTRRKWLVPEVVQTSSMDCGPAALKCVLDGFRVPVSYGRLREACQTDVDGTSIDSIEAVANQLGVLAQQEIVPQEHLTIDAAQILPAIVVVRQGNGAAHFVVVWRRYGRWLQLMDPTIGRRWVSWEAFKRELFEHQQLVGASEWRQWAASNDFVDPLRARMHALGLGTGQADDLIQLALTDTKWFGLAALDATVRFVSSVVGAGGIEPSAQARKLVRSLFEQTHASTADIFRIIPRNFWSAAAETLDDQGQLLLRLRGAVALRISASDITASKAMPGADQVPQLSQKSPDLAAALKEKPAHPAAVVWSLLRQDGLAGPVALITAMVVSAAVVLVEMLLFRGLFDMGWALNQPDQRLGGMLALIALVALLLVFQYPIFTESLRFGRLLELRLRMALLQKLPHLESRFFQSRPVSDMADRAHNAYQARMIPGFALHFVQAICDLGFTLLGIALIDPELFGLAFLLVSVAILIPLSVQPAINERDLRVRNHAGALHVFYLDALLGLLPIRAHRAQRAVRRMHEGLLVEWVRSSRGMMGIALWTGTFQSAACSSLAAWLLYQHFMDAASVTGADLLLIFWTLKLPSIGAGLTALIHQYPAQRNVLLRLLEPLSAVVEQQEANFVTPVKSAASLAPTNPAASPSIGPAAHIEIRSGSVLAGGHLILRDVNLELSRGEHVAVVGASGAGKSTLIGLLLGWHRMAQGEAFVDAEPLTSEKLIRLRRETAWVDPGIQLWNQSFMDNLTFASDVEDADMTGAVLTAADLRKVLQKLPKGLQSWLGEGGSSLSGGEGQRVRLARAFMQSGVRLALLDEPFRGLDRRQRAKLLGEARQWWRESTLICVTHDVMDTLNFDRVLVVKDGAIVEDGKPSQLASGSTAYGRLLDAESQVQTQLWKSARWRRWRIDNGKLDTSDRVGQKAAA